MVYSSIHNTDIISNQTENFECDKHFKRKSHLHVSATLQVVKTDLHFCLLSSEKEGDLT